MCESTTDLCDLNTKRPRRPSLVSVIIPTRNAVDTIGTQLDALARQSYVGEFEILVCDNGSVDGLREHLKARPISGTAPVRYVPADGVPGVSAARNVGVTRARGEFLAFCDADDVVRRDWLHCLVEAAACADLISGSRDTSVINSAVQHARRPIRPSAELCTSRFLPYAPGSNLGVWAAVVQAVGGFDETLLFGGEDMDFSWRVQLAGFTLVQAEHAVVDYRARPTAASFWSQVKKYAIGNVPLYIAYRDYGLYRRSWASFLLFLLNMVVRNPLLPQRITGVPRGVWLGWSAIVAGHLIGSVRYRTLFI